MLGLQDLPAGQRLRSDESRLFEAYWRSLPKGPGLLPLKSSFQAIRLPSLVPNIALATVDLEPPVRLLVRVAGEEFRAAAGASLRDIDLLDTYGKDLRESAAQSTRLMATRPCGLWQLSPVTSSLGLRAVNELTMLPLIAGEGGPVHIALLRQRRELAGARDKPKGVFAVETAREWFYIDLGAGVPA